jgi:ArsR family transcriptional regulator, arsenate/arsenite/antimonite-responsive transcriptional repressor
MRHMIERPAQAGAGAAAAAALSPARLAPAVLPQRKRVAITALLQGLFESEAPGILTPRYYFDIHRNMESSNAVTALAALAQESRLEIFRLLIQAGPEGMAAGAVAEKLGLAPNTLTFHFDRLRFAGLVTVRRDGRSMIYAARYEAMNGLVAFLTENCCQGSQEQCAPEQCAPLSVCKPKGTRHEAVSRARRR